MKRATTFMVFEHPFLWAHIRENPQHPRLHFFVFLFSVYFWVFYIVFSSVFQCCHSFDLPPLLSLKMTLGFAEENVGEMFEF